LTTMGLEPTIS